MNELMIMAALLVSLQLPQNGSMRRTDRDYDELTGPVRVVRIEGERRPEERPKGSKPERELEKIVTYDSSGRMKEQVEFDSYPAMCTRVRHIYVYDESGNRTETIYWGKGLPGEASDATRESSLLFHQSFKHDAQGRWTQVNDYNGSGQMYLETTYKYDETGRVNTIVSSRATCLLKYNAEGLIAEESCDRRSAGFNEKTIHTFTYDVDSRGNWVRRVASFSAIIDGKKVNQGGRIAYRLIEYSSGSGIDQTAAVTETNGSDFAKVSSCPPLTVRKSGGVLQQSATRRVAPPYPEEARGKRVSGPVVIEVSTDEDGKVVRVRTVSGPTELRRAAEEAAKQWEFIPTTLSKIPIRVIGTITFNFTL